MRALVFSMHIPVFLGICSAVCCARTVLWCMYVWAHSVQWKITKETDMIPFVNVPQLCPHASPWWSIAG